jgi:hypothetical protein
MNARELERNRAGASTPAVGGVGMPDSYEQGDGAESAAMHTILGAGGAIGNELVKELLQSGKRVQVLEGSRCPATRPYYISTRRACETLCCPGQSFGAAQYAFLSLSSRK